MPGPRESAGISGDTAIVPPMSDRHFRPGDVRRVGDADGEPMQDRLSRRTCGLVCFALFFSFIGTLLMAGGLFTRPAALEPERFTSRGKAPQGRAP